jgi:hypothetical protein
MGIVSVLDSIVNLCLTRRATARRTMWTTAHRRGRFYSMQKPSHHKGVLLLGLDQRLAFVV